jgi:uncharacterized protein
MTDAAGVDPSRGDDERRSVNEATVRAVFAGISAGAYDTLAEHVTEDLVFELPYAPEGIPDRTEGREAWDANQRMMFRLFERFESTVDAVYPGADPDLVIAEYHSDAVVRHNGNAYRNRYIGVFRFRDGRISAWKEFHDPRATDVLR